MNRCVVVYVRPDELMPFECYTGLDFDDSDCTALVSGHVDADVSTDVATFVDTCIEVLS